MLYVLTDRMTIKYIKRFHAGVSLVVFAVILYRFKIPRFFPFKYFSLKESIFLNSFSNLGAFKSPTIRYIRLCTFSGLFSSATTSKEP